MIKLEIKKYRIKKVLLNRYLWLYKSLQDDVDDDENHNMSQY